MKNKLLVFQPSLAPYRIDFFNALCTKFDAEFYFQFENLLEQKFNQNILKSRCRFIPKYVLKGFDLFGKSIRFGVISTILRHKPNYIFCDEYSPTTVQVFLFSKLFYRSAKIYVISDDNLKQSINRRGARALIRNLISKNIDGIIFTSKEVSKWYASNISSSTKTIELPIIHNENILRKSYEASLGIASENIKEYKLEGKKIILFVGRLVEVKNINFLIKCFAKTNNDDVILVIVGGGEKENELKLLSSELGVSNKIIFTGRKEEEDLYSWYTIAQIFALPSLHEPFGAVISEALVGGCFVMCSNYAGAASLINTENGVLFDPTNEEDFINKLHYSLERVNFVTHKNFLRMNLMSIKFDEMMKDFIEKILN
jgi:glycosyltransferase involved in cell wall biosynthesis